MLPKRYPTSGSFHMAHPSRPSIMEPSHVLPLRPVPKIQTMFSGLTPCCSPARDDLGARERMALPLLTTRHQACLSLGVNVVPHTFSGGRAGHEVIATIYSRKTYLHAGGHYTLTRSRLAAQAPPDLTQTPAKFEKQKLGWQSSLRGGKLPAVHRSTKRRFFR